MRITLHIPTCVVLVATIGCDQKTAINDKALAIYTKACQDVLSFEKQAMEAEEKDPATRSTYIDAVKSRFEGKILKYEVEAKRGRSVGYAMAVDLLEMQGKYEAKSKEFDGASANKALASNQKPPEANGQVQKRIIQVLAAANADLERILPPVKDRLTTPQ